MTVRRRRRPRLDTQPCAVVVAPGTLVYHDGQQRGGVVHGVPKHLAMQWLKQRFVLSVAEPLNLGRVDNASTADRTASKAQAAATTAPLRESDELRDAGPANQDHTDESHDHDANEPTGPASPQVSGTDDVEPMGGSLPPTNPHSPGRSDHLGLYASQSFGGGMPESGISTVQRLGADGSGVSLRADLPVRTRTEPVRSAPEPARTRTVSPSTRTGSRVCRNCLTPLAGRRKWCSDACRLQAYRRESGG